MKSFVKHLLMQAAERLVLTYDTYEHAYWVACQLLCFVAKTSHIFFIQAFSDDDLQLFLSYIDQIVIDKKPLEYIFGNTIFLNYFLYTEPPVLIPRPETEYFIDFCLKRIIKKKLKILDMCTGSGCIAIACAKYLDCLLVDAVDIDGAAIELCKKNIRHHEIKNIYVMQSDLFTRLDIHKKYDYIFCNPPYIPLKEYEKLDESVKIWESKIALTDQEDGLSIFKRVVREGCAFLSEKGFMALELSPSVMDEALAYVIALHLYSTYEIISDQYGVKRFLILYR